MDYKVFYTEIARKDLRRIPKEEVQKILRKISQFIKLKNPLIKAKKLKNLDVNAYRFRIGNYRIIFRQDEKTKKLIILVILRIVHSKDAYKN